MNFKLSFADWNKTFVIRELFAFSEIFYNRATNSFQLIYSIEMKIFSLSFSEPMGHNSVMCRIALRLTRNFGNTMGHNSVMCRMIHRLMRNFGNTMKIFHLSFTEPMGHNSELFSIFFRLTTNFYKPMKIFSLSFSKLMGHNSVMCRIAFSPAKWIFILLIFILLPVLENAVGGTDVSSLQAQSNSASRIPIPNLNFNVNEAKTPRETSLSLMILFLVTILSLAPAIVMSVTSFTKIVIVLDFVRRALSLQNLPPNQVMMGLALFMTFFIMAPTLGEINQTSLQPFMEGKIDTNTFFDKAMVPLRGFMIRQIGTAGTKDVALFLKLGKVKNVKSYEDVPSYVIVPAFMLSEIKKAFIIGIYIFIPFIVIDLVVAASLLSMGLMMLPPVMVSLPFKIILFILIDGWNLLVYELVKSYK